jgi:hypothetical protein
VLLSTFASNFNLRRYNVERDMNEADLVYDELLDCFSRKWRLVITGDYKDYKTSSLPLNAVIFITILVGDVLLYALMMYIIVQNYINTKQRDQHVKA